MTQILAEKREKQSKPEKATAAHLQMMDVWQKKLKE